MAAILLGFVAICIITWIVLDIGWGSLVGMRTALGAPRRSSMDVSHFNFSPPPRTQEIIHTLESLGFRRLGEAAVALPHRGLIHHWVLISADGIVQAETILERVSFSTFFGEKVVLVTDYPNGEHIEAPTYQSHTITTTIKDAFEYHLLQIAKFTAKYGYPHTISNMKDYLHWEKVGRVHYSSLKLRRFLIEYIARGSLSLYALLVIVGLPLAFRLGWLINTTMAEVELMVISLTLPVIVLAPRISLWTVKGGKRDSRIVARFMARKSKTSLREIIKRDEKEAYEDEELDDLIWQFLCTRIKNPEDLKRYPSPIAVFFASYLMEHEVGNGGFAQAAYNIPDWFEAARDAYRALGKPAAADVIEKVRQSLAENEAKVNSLRRGEIDWDDYFVNHPFHVFDEQAYASGEWEIAEARIAYVRANRNAFKIK